MQSKGSSHLYLSTHHWAARQATGKALEGEAKPTRREIGQLSPSPTSAKRPRRALSIKGGPWAILRSHKGHCRERGFARASKDHWAALHTTNWMTPPPHGSYDWCAQGPQGHPILCAEGVPFVPVLKEPRSKLRRPDCPQQLLEVSVV